MLLHMICLYWGWVGSCVTVASLTVVKSRVHIGVHIATLIPVHAVFLRTSVEEGWKYEP